MYFKSTRTESPNFNQIAYKFQVAAPPTRFKPAIERLIPQVASQPRRMLTRLQTTIDGLSKEFDQINPFRKKYLEVIARFIHDDLARRGETNILFICEHNSRRSHIAQIWAQTAAFYYGHSRIRCYSGGMKETAFYGSALEAIRKSGFLVEQRNESSNPAYEVFYSWQSSPSMIFSKKYDDPHNPQSNFMAIVTCSQMREVKSEVKGADRRFSLLYKDPREKEGTPEETEIYTERNRQIGRDMLYLFRYIKKLKEDELKINS